MTTATTTTTTTTSTTSTTTASTTTATTTTATTNNHHNHDHNHNDNNATNDIINGHMINNNHPWEAGANSRDAVFFRGHFRKVKIHQRGVQWKQGVVVYIILCVVLLYTPLRLHPPLMNTQKSRRQESGSYSAGTGSGAKVDRVVEMVESEMHCWTPPENETWQLSSEGRCATPSWVL